MIPWDLRFDAQQETAIAMLHAEQPSQRLQRTIEWRKCNQIRKYEQRRTASHSASQGLEETPSAQDLQIDFQEALEHFLPHHRKALELLIIFEDTEAALHTIQTEQPYCSRSQAYRQLHRIRERLQHSLISYLSEVPHE